MAWGTITVGSLVLKETDILTDATNANNGERAVKVEGAETVPGATLAELEAKREDIMGIIGRVVPVTFSRKSAYNGFYEITDTNTEFEKWVEGPAQVRWSLAMMYLGSENNLDIESRLANVVRANDFALTGERWHAPALGHYAYQAGASSPASVDRTGSDGVLRVYRAIPAATNPRWGATPTAFQAGRVRITQGGIERTGTNITLTPTGWEMSNGLVRVKADTISVTATLRVGWWTGGSWHDRGWDVRMSGTTIDDSMFRAATVIRNDPEACTLRVIAEGSGTGSRYLIDLTLRRGSRFVEGYVQRPSAGEITVVGDIVTTYTDNTVASGYVIETVPDADGNKAVVGSARTSTSHAQGGITKLAVTALDFYIGAEVAGSPPMNANPFFETNATDWTAFGGTFARSTAQFHQGAASGLLVPDGVAAAPRAETGIDAAVVGGQYKMSAWVRCSTARNVSLTINWYNASNVYISTSTDATVAVLANTWTPIEMPAVTAPALTAGMTGNVSLAATPPNTVNLWIDEAMTQAYPVSGDLAGDLRNQYIGAMAEKVRVARR